MTSPQSLASRLLTQMVQCDRCQCLLREGADALGVLEKSGRHYREILTARDFKAAALEKDRDTWRKRCEAAEQVANAVGNAIADSGGEAVSTPVVEKWQEWRALASANSEGETK